jgi:penicillin-binding protein 1A
MMKRWTRTPIALLAFVGILTGGLAGGFYGLIYDLPEINQLKLYRPSAVTTVYSADGQVITRFYLEKRFPVSLDDIPKSLIQALITTEDRGFYSHSGINLKAIARALVHDIKARRFEQGASTLTQQLAKTLFLSSEKSLVRKIREAILALQIERRYTKDEILELYLNQIYLGSGAYGVEAAARTYFNTTVSGLTLGQAALIAGLPKAPSAYSPLIRPDLAQKRRQIVLKQMRSEAVITKPAFDRASAEPVLVDSPQPSSDKAPYFTGYLSKKLKSMGDLGQASGLSIYTTLDMGLQHTAMQSFTRHMDRLEKRMQNAQDLQGAVVALDVHTGAIRCMIGGRQMGQQLFNRSVQAMRQPGSAFKPFVYAAALEQGWEQNQTLTDAPLSYDLPDGGVWQVNNFSKDFKGKMTLRSALALSKNTPAVRLAEKIGIFSVTDMARRAGIKAALPSYLSLALGTAEVSLLNLTSAYSSFPGQGIRARPHAIDRIEDQNGQVRYRYRNVKETVTDRITAALTTDMLKAVVLEGTARKARKIKTDIAGKTGTTDRYKDALFVGFSPALACGVWVGNDDATSLGPVGTGASAALPVWIDIMAVAVASHPVQYFDIPDGTKMVYILPDTGAPADPAIPGAVKALVRSNSLNKN